MHSRPLYGGLLSQYIKRNGDIQKHDSRPLYGGLLSQWKYDFESIRKLQFSSPLRGSLISILKKIAKEHDVKNSRPLYGGLLSQSCPLHLPKHKAFIPHLRGKPANERNLNIKLVYNIHKA